MDKIIKYKYLIIGIISVVIFGLALILNNDEYDSSLYTPDILKIEEEKEEPKKEEKHVYVDIKGHVNNAGVYKMNSSSRVVDVIESSGGLKDGADTSIINLGMKVFDEMVIIIYSKDKIEQLKKELKTPTIIEIIKEIEKECICPDETNDACINKDDNKIDENEKININTASKEMLMTISGIGESKANSIIEYRNNTKFESIQDIMNITGIGESVFEKIKDYITV